MLEPTVRYNKLRQDESETTTVFDYSSPFSYQSMDPKSYASIFEYNTPLKISEFDVQRDRGLSNKSLVVKLAYWSAVVVFTLLIVITFPVSAWFVIKRIHEDEQIVLSRLGIIKCIKGPTVLMRIPFVDKTTLYKTSLREFNIPPHKTLTSDGLLVEMGGTLRYHIVDAEKTCFAAQDIYHTMRVTAQTMTSKYIHNTREKDLTDTAGVQAINMALKNELQKTFIAWGIAVNSFEITGLKAILRVEQQDALSEVIEPLKQWFFGGHQAAPTTERVDSPMDQVASLFASMAPTRPNADPEKPHTPDVPEPAHTLESLAHTLTPKELLAAVKSVTNKQLVEQIGTVYKFVVKGDDPGIYFLDLKHGTGDCGPGEPPIGTADTCLTISLHDMQRMFTGSLQPFNAYMSGALEISGDTSGAMKLDELVKSITSISALTGS